MKQNNLVITAIIAALLLVLACKKEDSGKGLAKITTSAIQSVGANSAVSGGNITDQGESEVTERGVSYHTSSKPTVDNNFVIAGSGTGTFAATMTGLNPNTKYYVRAYAKNDKGVAYGNELSFTTSDGLAFAVISTTAISGITDNAAISGGNVSSGSGTPVTARGVVYATTQNPTLLNSIITSGNGLGVFTANLTGLAPGTTYYVRAYATNGAGTGYGNQLSFTTTGGGGGLATISTNAISAITDTGAASGGNISNQGGSAVTARGVAYATTANPTTANSTVAAGTGTGNFNANLTGLTPGTFYYVRAYATNSSGTAYGQQRTFTTTGGGANLPTLTTTAITNILANSARSGGNVTFNGGSSVTARGVVYSTTPNPTIANSVVNSGSGIGSFIAEMSGLNAGTTYYVRAFATNASGTGYGNELSFTTTAQGGVAVLTTTAVSNITTNSATSGGNISSDGGAAVTARGIAYATTVNPTTANSTVAAGIGTGNFSANLSGLTPNTTYYVRAYATNNNGTAYGNQVSFTTAPTGTTGCGALTTINYNGYTYKLVQIGTQCWFAENLRNTTYRNGTPIEFPGSNTAWAGNTTGAYAWYDNNISNGNTYGALYNYHAVTNAAGICPTGWKVPTDQEWCTLETALGITDACSTTDWRGTNQGSQLKDNVNWNGTNTSGFSGLGGGNRNPPGSYGNFGSNGYWWTSTTSGGMAWYRVLGSNRGSVNRNQFSLEAGFSVRCIKE